MRGRGAGDIDVGGLAPQVALSVDGVSLLCLNAGPGGVRRGDCSGRLVVENAAC